MDINEIIKLADEAYDADGVISCHWNEKTRSPRKVPLYGMGDTLAKFIAIEIYETFSPNQTDEEQLITAASAIAKAADQCRAVADALDQKGWNIPSGQRTGPKTKVAVDEEKKEAKRASRRAVAERLQKIVNHMMEKEE